MEVAKGVVRTAQQAADQVGRELPCSIPEPKTAIEAAVGTALQRHLPGLAGTPTSLGILASGSGGRAGRWYRRGNRIVLVGA